MGQVPSKYFPAPLPYGQSPAITTLTPSQPAAVNPQTPLLPPNFSDPGTMVNSTSPAKPAAQALQQQLYGRYFNP